MKNLFTLLLLASFALSTSAQSSILSFTVSPANPTTNDTIYVIVNTSFSSGDCPLDYKSHSLTEKTISAITHHCVGVLAVICGAVDTFKIDPLAAGTYKFDLTLTSGALPAPCTPGIVIDDQDSTFFTVSPATSIDESFLPGLSFENPVREILRFNTPLPDRAYIFNSMGQLVKVAEAGETEISVSGLGAGLYFLHMNAATRSFVIH